MTNTIFEKLALKCHTQAMKQKCPNCSSTNLYWAYDCHTYKSGTNPDGTLRFVSCHPCDSAIRYSCGDCRWTFVHGLNKANPRTEENEKSRPDWIVGDLEFTKNFFSPIPAPGVVSIWDDDE